MNRLNYLMLNVVFVATFLNYVNTSCSLAYEEFICPYTLICDDYYYNLNENINTYDLVSHYNNDYFQRYNDNRCEESIQYGDTFFHPVKLVFKSTEIIENISIPVAHATNDYDDSNGIILDITISLDISNNGAKQMPIINTLPNLLFVNVSNNNLHTAVLSNINQLNKLNEIDFSYNFIKEIYVNKTCAYKRITKVNLSHNVLTNISDGIFDVFEELHTLDLSYNNIATINKFSFKGLSKLFNLNLSNNKLKYINGSICGLSKLRIFNVSHNQITNITEADFSNLKDLIQLDLSSNSITTLNDKVFDAMIELENVDLNNNHITVIHKDLFRNSLYLKSVDFSNNQLEQLPEYLFKNTTIFSFHITGNKLVGSLKRGMFNGVQATELDLSEQFITEIGNYSFNDLFSLETLLLSSNRIQSLSNMCFKTLKNLQRLDLSNNQITNIDFDKGDLIKLESLTLKNNLLTEITKVQLLNLKKLKDLDLSKNLIHRIEPDSMKSLSKLVQFQINGNDLVGTLSTGTLNGLTSLANIDLSSNTNLILLQNASFNNMNGLREVNISNCKLNEIEYNVFVHTVHIKIIDLSHNNLTNFFINTTELVELDMLYLNDNNIKYISSSILSRIVNLNKITLFHNDIEKVYSEGMSHIVSLDLYYNNIKKLQIGYFDGMKQLITLDLSFNKIIYLQPGVFKDNYNLISLNISHNYLSVVGFGVFRGLTNLHTLNISYNYINDLQVERFFEVNNLRTLIVDHNKIEFVNTADLKSMQLHELSISNNPLPCELLVKLYKDNPELIITAIILDEHPNENVRGVTCNKARATEKQMPFEFNDNNFNLTQYSTRNISQTTLKEEQIGFENKVFSSFEYIPKILNISNSIDENLSSINNNTNIIIELLNHTLAKATPSSMNTSQLNMTKGTLGIPKINNNKNYEQNDMIENENVRRDITNITFNQYDSRSSDTKLDHVVVEYKFSSFTNICVALILLTLIAIVVHKFYKNRVLISNRFTSRTYQLSHSQENSNL